LAASSALDKDSLSLNAKNLGGVNSSSYFVKNKTKQDKKEEKKKKSK
jgi:hypothetical protein